MVFCGKPSESCHACRQRKTKCDKIPEGCTQCKRAKRGCPGYRVLGDLLFRDESTNVARKVKAKEAKKQGQAALPQRSGSELSEEEDPNLEATPKIVQQQDPHLSGLQLAPTVDELATGFFITNYVVGDSAPAQRQLELIEEISRFGNFDNGLLSSMKAVGLAGIAHAANAPHLLKSARYQYVRAIQSTNATLRDPVEAKKDSTLMAILILGIFESVTGCHQMSLKDWAKHVNGAAAVVKLRGPDQIKTNSGRRMLMQVAAHLLVSCIARGVALPEHIIEYLTAIFNLVQTPDPAFVVQVTIMNYSSLLASIRNNTLTDKETIISQALELDANLLKISTDRPPGWEYTEVFTSEPTKFVFNGCYHIYRDHWMAYMWNALRTTRILLHELIRETLLLGFCSKPPTFNTTEHTAQFQISTDTMYAMQSDILCTVPQHIGQFPTGKTAFESLDDELVHPVRTPPFTYPPGQGPITTMSGGSMLLWPLCIAALLDIASEEVREFVISNLNNVGRTMGIMRAHVLAEIIRARQGITVWKDD
jgi:hypothetical protein